jgi:regulator of ribonuclease activity A
MSRSLVLERIRINIEIFCESIGDFLASSFGGLKKPIIGLAWLALVMTIRSARKGVLKMKRGGLTAGRYESSYKSFASAGSAGGSNSYWNQNAAGSTGTYGGSYGSHNAAAGAYGSQNSVAGTYGTQNSAAGTYGTQNSAAGAYASNLPGRSYTSASSNNLPGTAGTTYGQTAYNNPSQHTSGATSSYGNSAGASGSLSSDQAQRSLSDLIDKHGQSIRVMDSRLFKDYGGIHDFYGQVETLQAFEGAGVVEKVLQSPGYNKVLVVDGGGNVNAAIFTKLAAASAKQNGWKGVVIHGAIRDSKHIASTAIGCKAMGTNPNRGRGTTGSKGLSLNIAGLPVTTGMWIYCDKVR